jgi:hypothetical protein
MGSGGSKGLVQDDGFGMFCGVFDHSDIEACGAWLQAETIVQSRAGARHLMQYAAVRQFAGDPRLLSIARRFLGADPIPFRATLFDKSARRNWLVAWHQDTALPLRRRVDVTGWGPWSMKGGVTYAHAPAAALSHVVALRVHIDDSGSDNGPLRVLPGTHLRGVLSDAQLEGAVRHIRRWSVLPQRAASWPCVHWSCMPHRRPIAIARDGCYTLSTLTMFSWAAVWSWRWRESD